METRIESACTFSLKKQIFRILTGTIPGVHRLFLTVILRLEAPERLPVSYRMEKFRLGSSSFRPLGAPPSDVGARKGAIWRVERPWGPPGA